MLYEKELDAAIQAVINASQLCQHVQKTLCTNETVAKQDRSPVTIADFGSQALIIREIREAFPNDPVVGEEDAGILRENDSIRGMVVDLVHEYTPATSEKQILEDIDFGVREVDFTKRYWTLDPIDGTKGFLRGDQYAIALALIEDGEVVLGALACPNLAPTDDGSDDEKGCVQYAVKGEGAFQRTLSREQATRIRVNEITDPRQAWFCESVEKGHSSHDVHERIAELLGITRPPYRIDSQCKYAVVARGGVPIYLRLARGRDYREKIWDHAAGSFIVSEAGGKVTDFSNKPLNFSVGRSLAENVGILATNGHLHADVLKAINQVLEA